MYIPFGKHNCCNNYTNTNAGETKTKPQNPVGGGKFQEVGVRWKSGKQKTKLMGTIGSTGWLTTGVAGAGRPPPDKKKSRRRTDQGCDGRRTMDLRLLFCSQKKGYLDSIELFGK